MTRKTLCLCNYKQNDSKPILASGKPILASGKPILASGKPILASGKPISRGSKRKGNKINMLNFG